MARAEGQASADAAGASRSMENEYRRESSLAARQQLGTGHGQRRWDAATTTAFERESGSPNQVLSVWYDAREALVARGILPRHWRGPYGTPEAFPIGFTPDP
jgi:hypothetical protein